VNPVHIARVRVYQDKRPNRRAYIGDFPEPVRYGVNTGVKAFYKMEPERSCRARSTIWSAPPPGD